MYNGGGESNDDVGVVNVDMVNINGCDAAHFGNGNSKFDCGANRGGGDMIR